MKKWSEEAWEASLPIIEKIKRLAFLEELADGTLSPQIFQFYISQDSLYLDNYTRVLAHIASRLPEMEDVSTFLGFAADGVAVEKALHASYNPDKSLPKSLACEFYTSYLKARGESDIAIEAASILPCFWVYLEVGKYILSQAKLDGNRYRAWIETYSDPTFDESTRRAIDVCDRLADMAPDYIRQQMTQTFIDCTQLEMLFWQSAYHLGQNDMNILNTGR